jgi:hypothetical protein
VFAAKCAGCHGPEIPRPRGRFGYVLDLRRVAGNPELVIPGRPEESELWALVLRGDMPPADSPHGPLVESEKETIRAWIAAGAPAAGEGTGTPTPSPVRRAVRWLGRFHLLVLHFPIALVLAAGAGEVASAWRGSRVPAPAVQFCLCLAAIAAVPAVALGWLHAAAGGGVASPQLLTAHRWLGTAAGAWVVGTALWARRDVRRGVRSPGVRVALVVVGVPLIIATAHAGGMTAHGRDFLEW